MQGRAGPLYGYGMEGLLNSIVYIRIFLVRQNSLGTETSYTASSNPVHPLQAREMKREEASEVPLLRDTCRHQREELRELQKLKHEVPELRRQPLSIEVSIFFCQMI